MLAISDGHSVDSRQGEEVGYGSHAFPRVLLGHQPLYLKVHSGASESILQG